jgi:hypothetical protein
MGGRDSRTIGLWIGAVALLVLTGLDLVAPDREQMAAAADRTWSGTDFLTFTGSLVGLDRAPVSLDVSGLRLWVVARDLECSSCLNELPAISDLVGELAGEMEHMGPEMAAVAFGDFHEARRTFLGLEMGMPVYVSTSIGVDDVLAHLGAAVTPARVITWYGRVVAWSDLSVHERAGRSELAEILKRWSGG